MGLRSAHPLSLLKAAKGQVSVAISTGRSAVVALLSESSSVTACPSCTASSLEDAYVKVLVWPLPKPKLDRLQGGASVESTLGADRILGKLCWIDALLKTGAS